MHPRAGAEVHVGLDIVEWKLHGAGIKVDKDESISRQDQFDLKQTIGLRVESRRFVKFGRLDQPTGIVILPTMVFTRKPSRGSTGFPNHRVCSVSTHIVERSDYPILAQNNKEGNSRDVESVIIPGLVESTSVADKQPRLDYHVSPILQSHPIHTNTIPNVPC